jgi:N-formylglutamate amidohydrolase
MELFRLEVGDGPVVAAAIHNGQLIRPAIAELSALSEAERLREQDPFTDVLAEVAPTRLIGLRSRFEMDLNRPREQAVYLTPADAWGLNIWRASPADALRSESLANYDLFYATAEALLRQLVARHERVVVLDLHTYNHRRDGPAGQPADPEGNPEVNVGTGSMDRGRWAPIVDRFMADLRAYDYFGRGLDVRENVKFFGGNFCRWIHLTFPGTVCALAVEFKKTFMDEWTGEVDRRQFAKLQAALRSTLPGLAAVLNDVKSKAAANAVGDA